MNNDILDAVIECLKDLERCQFHGSFVNYLVRKDYVRATWQADAQNLRVMGYYIKWREWLYVRNGIVYDDCRAELKEAEVNALMSMYN